MDREDDLLRQIEALRERFSKLSEASLRINESLDFDTVLQGVLDSACRLTQARFGVMILLDETGAVQDFLSSGLTPEEAQQIWGHGIAGAEVFDYFNSLQEPWRVPDLLAHLRSMSLPELSDLPVAVGFAIPFLAAPVFHRGERFGNIFLAQREVGEEFTQEDQETLLMFASHAAMVMANARRYRDEERARKDLETLINTSPVGVAVFDGRSGTPLSFNAETARIIDKLRNPDQTPEHLLDVMTIRRADGREISLEELSMSQLLSAGETVRAEEVALQVGDGRSVTALINGTPIRSDDGEVETFVVTIQDMTPLEEIERLRAEFLAMVSHELRTPLTSVKGSIATLMDSSVAMNLTEMRQFFRIIDIQIDRMQALISDLLDVARIATGNLSIEPGPADLAVLTAEAGNAFRVGGFGHGVHIDVPTDLPWVMVDSSRILQVLGNLLSNAARHSPESSIIRIRATPGDLHVSVSVSDDGRGIPAESMPNLFRKFSRLESEEQGGDTGLGLAVCKGIVEAHGGRIWAESDGPGLGATFTFTLPTVEEAGFLSPVPTPQVSSSPSQRSGPEQVRILAVDDDAQALRFIRDALVKSGYAVVASRDPGDAPRLMEEENFHLVLLDLMLPGADGIELMKELLAVREVPVIFVSAYGQDHLVARAFEMGADDYVVKPFSPTELVARIRAALRRRKLSEPRVPYVLGDLTINYAERLVTLAGKPIELTATQYGLLAELSVNAGRVLTYEYLLRRVWGADGSADVRPMRTIVSGIRRKLGDDPDNPTYIFTELRVGYRMPIGQGQASPK